MKETRKRTEVKVEETRVENRNIIKKVLTGQKENGDEGKKCEEGKREINGDKSPSHDGI